MKYLNINTRLEYFNSLCDNDGKAIYGKPIADNAGCYHIKFCCKYDLAVLIGKEFKAKYPTPAPMLTCHVNKLKTNIIFGGKFPVDSRAKNILWDLMDKHKQVAA